MINDVFVVDAAAHSNLGEDNYAVGRYSQAVAPGSEIDQSEDLRVRYRLIREFSDKLRETLEPEDCVVQTMPEASPVKWHLAHTSWFFETFVLKEALPNHNPIHAQYAYLFNSYYNAAGKMHCRPKRGLISRPTLRETLEYRRRVDGMMEAVFEKPAILEKFAPVIRLGLHHEQQHQELILRISSTCFPKIRSGRFFVNIPHRKPLR